MKKTKEQEQIIKLASNLNYNESLQINAFAGTGKTSTLIEIVKEMPDSKILYLAFNNSIVAEAKKRFPTNNCDVMTTHSLAFKHTDIKKDIKKEYKAIELMKIYDIEYEEGFSLIKILEYFTNSKMDLKTAKKIIKNKKISDLFEIFWKDLTNRKLNITHNVYLKEFQLNKYEYNLDYDCVLLDEAQDTNEVTIDIFNHFKCAKIYVGDEHQQIYQFRGSTNALEKLKSTYKLYLTNTFRCRPEIVNIANNILKKYKKETKEIISFNNKFEEIKKTAVISRTNTFLIFYMEKFDSFYSPRNIDLIFAPLLAMYYFYRNELDKISLDYKFLTYFKNWDDLSSYLTKIKDIELSTAFKMVERFKDKILFLYMKAKDNNNINSNIILTTAHSSKGLEFDKVILAEDFPCLEEIKQSYKNEKKLEIKETLIQEANLFYVAVTRAKYEIENNSKNKEFFKL